MTQLPKESKLQIMERNGMATISYDFVSDKNSGFHIEVSNVVSDNNPLRIAAWLEVMAKQIREYNSRHEAHTNPLS